MGTAFAAVPILVCGLKSQFDIVSRVLFVLLANSLFYVGVKAFGVLCRRINKTVSYKNLTLPTNSLV